jgi:hypothetical protein
MINYDVVRAGRIVGRTGSYPDRSSARAAARAAYGTDVTIRAEGRNCGSKGVCRVRRKYTLGKCQDCGWVKRTTVITFWVNGMKYRVCAQCIKPYRGSILK